MLNLPSKSPGQRLDYGWDIPVDTGDTVISATISVVSGDVEIVSQSLDFSIPRLIFVLSGGTAGTITQFYVVANTSGGDIFDDTIGIFVGGAASVPPPYSDPTPSDIKADFPIFATVDDAAIQRRIARSSMWVDDSWLESDYTWAKELLVAYWLTKDGLGAGTNAELAAQGLSGVSRLKSGTLDVTFKSSSDSGDTDTPSPWNENGYGIEFYTMLRKNKSGPLTTGGACGGISGAATDTPFAWQFGGFAL